MFYHMIIGQMPPELPLISRVAAAWQLEDLRTKLVLIRKNKRHQ